MEYLNDHQKEHHERVKKALKNQPKSSYKKVLELSKKHLVESGQRPRLRVLSEIREKLKARITELRSKKK